MCRIYTERPGRSLFTLNGSDDVLLFNYFFFLLLTFTDSFSRFVSADEKRIAPHTLWEVERISRQLHLFKTSKNGYFGKIQISLLIYPERLFEFLKRNKNLITKRYDELLKNSWMCVHSQPNMIQIFAVLRLSFAVCNMIIGYLCRNNCRNNSRLIYCETHQKRGRETGSHFEWIPQTKT